MNYIDYINRILKDKLLEHERVVAFGQNIAAGSCLSGLTRGLTVKNGGRIINTPNSESTLCGVGMGAMMNGVNSIFFMKQLDFLLLGVDQLVNTFNIARRKSLPASFTIFAVIVDSGYEGPQSSLNNLSDFCSIARIPGYTINGKAEADQIIKRHLYSPGLQIIGVSQRLFKTDLFDRQPIREAEDCGLFQYAEGNYATIVCFNLSLGYGWELWQKLEQRGRPASLFSVTASLPINWDVLLADIKKTQRLVVFNDSKSVNTVCHQFMSAIPRELDLAALMVLERSYAGYSYRPKDDQLEVDYNRIVTELK